MANLYLFNNGNFKKFSNVELLPYRYISVNGNEPTPVEDYGDCFLTEENLTVDEAFSQWCEK